MLAARLVVGGDQRKVAASRTIRRRVLAPGRAALLAAAGDLARVDETATLDSFQSRGIHKAMVIGAGRASYDGFGSYGRIGARFARRYDKAEYRGMGSWGSEALEIARRVGADVVTSTARTVAGKLTGSGSKPPPPPPPEKKGIPWGWIAGGGAALVGLVLVLRR